VREVRTGVWHWQGPHPQWEPDAHWQQVVSSYAIDTGEGLLLFDPLAPPAEIEKLAEERETAIVLTCPWHERDARSLVDRFGLPVYTPPPDTAEDLMQKFGLTAEQTAGWSSPDIAWLLAGGQGEARLYSAGDRLPIGIEAFPGREHNDVVLWVESRRAVVAGDTLADFGQGFGIRGGVQLREGVSREQVVDGLRPLLDRPVEVVLPAHGAPTDRAALERALS
jgi:glyoxylase-like metal-dependent hydrolase (beta-lactamase superfamily II)